MYTRLGLMNGEIIVSDVWTEKEIQDEIDKSDGRLGTKDFSEVRVEDVDDAMAFIGRVIDMALDDLKGGTVTIVSGGKTLEYKSKDVAWYRTVR